MRSILVGFFQALAIIPGISRSGLTISGGFLAGMEPVARRNFRFSWRSRYRRRRPPRRTQGGTVRFSGRIAFPLTGAMLIALLLGLLSLKLLMALVKRIRIDVFGYYTIAAGCGACYTPVFVKAALSNGLPSGGAFVEHV